MPLLAQLSPEIRAGLAGLTAAFLALFLTPLVRSFAVRSGLISRPCEERWKKKSAARLGGAAMFVSFVGSSIFWLNLDQSILNLLAGSAAVFLLGLFDDLKRMAPYVKLLAQLLIGCMLVFAGLRIEIHGWIWLSIPLSILWFVFVMNAFNLLDNMDGLAAGTGAIAAAFFAVHAGLAQHWPMVTLSSILCGVCLGFLRFNFPNAKIYMGDSGSHFLGLTLAVIPILGPWGHSTQLLSVLAVPVLMLAVPIFDTCFVTIQRLVHGQHPFVGGRDHVSHRLAFLGLSTRQTILTLYTISICAGLLSVAVVHFNPLPTLALCLVAVALLVVFGRYLTKVKVYRIPEASETSSTQEAIGEAHVEMPITLIETMLMHKRRLLEMLLDFFLLSSAYVAAYMLRFEGNLSYDLQKLILESLPVILTVKLACFALAGLYRGVWRYLGLMDIVSIFKGVLLGSTLSAIAVLFLWRFEGYSRAVFIIDGLISFFAISGVRVAERLLDEWIHHVSDKGLPLLIMGAGHNAARVLRALDEDNESYFRIIGCLDDDPRKLGNRIHGVSVLGSRRALPKILEDHAIQEVLIAISDPPGELLQYIQQCCKPRNVPWRVVSAGITAHV